MSGTKCIELLKDLCPNPYIVTAHGVMANKKMYLHMLDNINATSYKAWLDVI